MCRGINSLSLSSLSLSVSQLTPHSLSAVPLLFPLAHRPQLLTDDQLLINDSKHQTASCIDFYKYPAFADLLFLPLTSSSSSSSLSSAFRCRLPRCMLLLRRRRQWRQIRRTPDLVAGLPIHARVRGMRKDARRRQQQQEHTTRQAGRQRETGAQQVLCSRARISS